MKTLLRAWDRFFFSRFDPYSLGLLRISTGTLYLVLMGFLYCNWERFYGAEGFSGAVDPTLWHDPWTLFRFTDGVMSVTVWWWIGAVAGALFVVGFFTRTMSIIVFLVLSSMLHREILLAGAEDLVLRMVFFWMILMPMGRSMSVDAWLRRRLRGQPDTRPLPMIWATRMLQINVALIFAMSLPRKLTMDPAWLNGDAFYFAIINDTWAKWPWPEMFYVKWMSMLGTYGAILVEGAFPILVWTRWRVPMVLVMWSFHIMLAVMLNNVALFSLSVAVTYWVFIPPETARAWIARARAWGRTAERSSVDEAGARSPSAPANP